MRRPVGWVVGVVVAAACTAAHLEPRTAAPVLPDEPLAAGLIALGAGASNDARRLFTQAAERYPALADYVLYFRARTAARAAHPADTLQLADTLVANEPDSVWIGATQLLRGRLLAAAGDLAGARGALRAAHGALPRTSARGIRAALSLAELEDRLGNPDAALELTREIRRGAPRGLAARRARRLAERIRRARPDLVDLVDEAELRLREGDLSGARDQTEVALQPDLAPPLRARLLWVRAQAEHGLDLDAAAEATCVALAREVPGDPLAPRALTTAGTWRWNADDDADALRLFHDVVRRFPDSPQAPDALYAIGRIAQEDGRYDDARSTYTQLAERYPRADVAGEARWRAAWVRWLGGDMAAAERAFAAAAAKTRDTSRAAAEYWRARALERLGREAEAETRLDHVADHHWTTYYAGLAEERLGRQRPAGEPPAAAAPPPFPETLPGRHGERARLLAGLGFRRFARLELDALAAGEAPRRALLDAYRAIGAVAPALRLAHALRPASSPGPLAEYIYPLGYWDVVRPAASARGLDPLLVTALIRQESLFDPDAVSPAGARGLMQLLPATARRVRQTEGAPAPPVRALHDVATNVDLGVAHFAALLARYNGSAAKALAAYNGGEEAVAKWERRYGGRDADEFIELISYRETRDYVKAVLRNYRLYRLLYAAPSASVSSAGSPPNAPFDMITMTSPRRALPAR